MNRFAKFVWLIVEPSKVFKVIFDVFPYATGILLLSILLNCSIEGNLTVPVGEGQSFKLGTKTDNRFNFKPEIASFLHRMGLGGEDCQQNE